MAELEDAAAMATDERLRAPLTAAIVRAAVQVSAEDPATAGHEAREALALQVIRSPTLMAEPFAWAVSTNPTTVGKWTAGDITGAVADLPFVVSTVWDAMAGA